MATADNWEEIIRTNYTDLLKIIDTENGLHGELRKAQIFPPMALKTFWGCRDKTARIDQMLVNLQRRGFDSFRKFCQALTDNNQEHVVRSYLSCVRTFPSPSVESDAMPDASAEHYCMVLPANSRCLSKNWNELIMHVECEEEFLGKMESLRIFTQIQFNKLRDKEGNSRMEHLLNLLERGSEKQFRDFCTCLRETRQAYIVNQYLTPRLPTEVQPETPDGNSLKETHQAHNVNDYLTPRLPTGVQPETPDGTSTVQESVEESDTAARSSSSSGCSECGDDAEDLTPGCSGFSKVTAEFLDDIRQRINQKEVYRCTSCPRGRAVIINNEYFTNGTNCPRRAGAKYDTTNLRSFFQELHFETALHEGKTAEQIMDILKKEVQNEAHSRCDMFVLFLLSHGIKGTVYGIDCKPVKTNDVIALFDGKNCKALVDKPKLFFIQACQGAMKTEGVVQTDSAADADEEEPLRKMLEELDVEDDLEMSIPLQQQQPKLPSDVQCDAVLDPVHEQADMAVVYATVRGYAAFRRPDSGSLFVRCIVDVFSRKAHRDDFISMMTEVFKVLHDTEARDTGRVYRQIGETRSRLRKKVYLLPC